MRKLKDGLYLDSAMLAPDSPTTEVDLRFARALTLVRFRDHKTVFGGPNLASCGSTALPTKILVPTPQPIASIGCDGCSLRKASDAFRLSPTPN
jgi:hypothetical protein